MSSSASCHRKPGGEVAGEGRRYRCCDRAVVKELISKGLEGEELLAVVQELTGYSVWDALQLIAIETGASKGDIVLREDEAD
jgi:hypothetical protein